MKVYTIADIKMGDQVKKSWPHNNHYKMGLVWLNYNMKYMKECEIVLYYTFEEDNAVFTDHYQNFLKNFSNVTLKKLEPAYGFPIPRPTLAMLPYVRNYMMSVWDEPAPYVWMDTDYFLLRPLKDFYKHLDNHPFIATGHGGYRRDKQRQHMNGGFYGMGTDDFINCEEVYRHMTREFPEGSGGRYAGDHWRQQHAINEWVKVKNYDPFGWDEEGKHYFWNWFGRDCHFKLKDDGTVSILNERDEEIYGAHFFGTYKPFRFQSSRLTFWREELKKIERMGTVALDPKEDWGD